MESLNYPRSLVFEKNGFDRQSDRHTIDVIKVSFLLLKSGTLKLVKLCKIQELRTYIFLEHSDGGEFLLISIVEDKVL